MGNIALKDFLWREFEDFKRELNHGSIQEAAAEYQKFLNEMKNLPLHIAVTGQTGSGKSSFVNAFRGVKDDDDEAAEVRTVEGTLEPKAYPHPSLLNIKIWDLPGIGTWKFKAVEYMNKVKFEKYDIFIIVTSDRFTENDALLAKEIQRMRKTFYFVRTKIDASIDSEKRKRNFSMERSLEKIRKYCEDSLKEAVGLSARVFLISNWKAHMYDFPLLQETMATELPVHKKHILTQAAQIFSEHELMRKKDITKSYIKKVALISCAFGAVSVPGLSMVCDIGILLDALKRICNVFSLDDRSLSFLALQTGIEFEELRSAIKKTPLADTIDIKLILSLLSKSSVWVNVSVMEVALNFVPVLGSLFGGASSFAVTYYFLNTFLEDAMEDSRNVRAKLLT